MALPLWTRLRYRCIHGTLTNVVKKFISCVLLEQDKFGGPMNLMRDTSKEISDRVADRFPVAPPSVSAKTLVDTMVR
jgi:hypothetical protein